ncbi:hypothetical protein [Orgyia leucostigma nucleopolyhedrovirus]|uniref:Uncharacterized protein n=1 Tax=Orgyia leucostigma nucleopolyhedrovirus TaxID=490711 RepID=B0FDX1_9ABAC|nr:hypothetical protein [Orgyia leucostigma nucleopolyhedrovirus]ABY65829.1 hypothetical protein [Orgyia leucostigma nucleopolyhedrovirus]
MSQFNNVQMTSQIVDVNVEGNFDDDDAVSPSNATYIDYDRLYVCETLRGARLLHTDYTCYYCLECLQTMIGVEPNLEIMYVHRLKTLGVDALQSIECENCECSLVQRFAATSCQDCAEFCASLYRTVLSNCLAVTKTPPVTDCVFSDASDYVDYNYSSDRRKILKDIILNPIKLYDVQPDDNMKWLAEFDVSVYECYFPVSKLEDLKVRARAHFINKEYVINNKKNDNEELLKLLAVAQLMETTDDTPSTADIICALHLYETENRIDTTQSTKRQCSQNDDNKKNVNKLMCVPLAKRNRID